MRMCNVHSKYKTTEAGGILYETLNFKVPKANLQFNHRKKNT